MFYCLECGAFHDAEALEPGETANGRCCRSFSVELDPGSLAWELGDGSARFVARFAASAVTVSVEL